MQPRVTDLGGSRSPVGGVQLWYDEIKRTPGGKGAVKDFSLDWAKYAQIVWASTTDLGCVYSSDTLLCQYGNAGNQPNHFEREVRPQLKPGQYCGLQLEDMDFDILPFSAATASGDEHEKAQKLPDVLLP